VSRPRHLAGPTLGSAPSKTSDAKIAGHAVIMLKKLYEIDFRLSKGSLIDGERLYPLGFSFSKHTGDCHGQGGPASDEADMLESLVHYIEQVLRFDSILGRFVDPPNQSNTIVTIQDGVKLTRRQVWQIIKTTITRTKGKTLEQFFTEPSSP
jgi:hypothetical protein